MEFNREQQNVADSFQTGMAPYQKEPLVLYGIGLNTQAVLALSKGYSFAGLLDQDEGNTGKEFYGKKVLSLEQVPAVSHRIVIIARTSVTPIIFHRISSFAQKHHISVHDYSGRELRTGQQRYTPADLDYWNSTWPGLKESIEQHDVISFDIFDTLLGRYVLQPKDVFSLLEQQLRQEGRAVAYASMRAEAERACGYAASLGEIYERLCQNGISKADCMTWRARELQWEQKLTFPRERVVQAFQYARSLGKQVFLTSDMYLPKSELERLLQSHGICGYDDLLVSCEEKAEKSDGALFQKLLSKTGEKTVLHIGDNRFSDVDMAQKAGLDTWQVYSSYDLFMVSSLQRLLAVPKMTLGDRLVLGMLCARLFEDPFALHPTRGVVTLSKEEELGRCFLGPWALGIVQWMAKKAESRGIEQILFPSRDGFLFYHVARIAQKQGAFRGVALRYIKASRVAASSAAICSKSDLETFLKMRGSYYYGKPQQTILQECFSIEPDPALPKQQEKIRGYEDLLACLEPHIEQIIQHAAQKRKNYHVYLKQQGIDCAQKTAIFDFVAAGTVQFYLEKLLKTRMLGLYAAVMDNSYLIFPEKGRIEAAYGTIAYYGGSETALSHIYTALETILVDGDEMLLYFDETGRPVFRPKSGTDYEPALAAQRCACQFVSEYLWMFGAQELSLPFLDQLIGTIFDSTACGMSKALRGMFLHDEVPAEEIESAWSGSYSNS